MCSPGGRQKIIRALVDTGAQVSLIKKGLFSDCEFSRAKSPLTLIAANGQLLEGGKKVINLKMRWNQPCDEGDVEPEVEINGEFF